MIRGHLGGDCGGKDCLTTVTVQSGPTSGPGSGITSFLFPPAIASGQTFGDLLSQGPSRGFNPNIPTITVTAPRSQPAPPAQTIPQQFFDVSCLVDPHGLACKTQESTLLELAGAAPLPEVVVAGHRPVLSICESAPWFCIQQVYLGIRKSLLGPPLHLIATGFAPLPKRTPQPKKPPPRRRPPPPKRPPGRPYRPGRLPRIFPPSGALGFLGKALEFLPIMDFLTLATYSSDLGEPPDAAEYFANLPVPILPTAVSDTEGLSAVVPSIGYIPDPINDVLILGHPALGAAPAVVNPRPVPVEVPAVGPLQSPLLNPFAQPAIVPRIPVVPLENLFRALTIPFGPKKPPKPTYGTATVPDISPTPQEALALQPCDCPPASNKKKGKKKQPRQKCFKGIYYERANGLRKFKRKEIPCQ